MDKNKLTLEELNYVQREVSVKTRNLTKAYMLAVFLGPLGIHRAYFGKTKTAVLKTITTIALIGTIVLIVLQMANINMTIEATRSLLVDNAKLAVPFISLSFIWLTWTLADLFLIPKWKRQWDDKNREKASADIIQGRYVSTQLLRNQLSEELIESAKSACIEELKKMLLDMNSGKLPRLEELIISDEKTSEELNDESEKEKISNQEDPEVESTEITPEAEVIQKDLITNESTLSSEDSSTEKTLENSADLKEIADENNSKNDIKISK